MIRSIAILGCALAVLLPAPVLAQTMPSMNRDMPQKPQPKAKPKPIKHPAHPTPATSPAQAGAERRDADVETPTPQLPATETGPRPAPGKMAEDMPGMAMPEQATPATHMDHAMPGMVMAATPALSSEGSGTARNPGNDGAMHGLHIPAGAWMVMLHGYAWGIYTDQGGPRGANEAFVQSMAMLAAARDYGTLRVQGRAMLSLEPLMGARGYPNLFATGETADGTTQLIDHQHPHDLFMELAARIDVDAGAGSVFVYGGPVAEPALGPSAFMHRASAHYEPLSPITHHWFDSTHISYGVITVGYAAPRWQIEASGFRGREPDQQRWNIERPSLDSWSVRATWTPSPAWAVQVSHGRIESPEQLEAFRDEARTTASVQYARGGVSTLLAYAIKEKRPGRTLSAWLAEANWDIDRHHTLFARAENVANDELFPDPADPLHDATFRVTKLEGGYAYRLPLAGPVDLALGGALGVYAKPAALDAAYGRFPVSFSLFAKVSLGQ